VRDVERRELAAGVADQARRLSVIVDNLLDLTRLEAGRAEPRRGWVALDDVLDAATEGLDRERIDFRVDAELPLLHADASQLERVFHNLLENALEHSTETVQVRSRVVGARIMVRVVDAGPGIPVEEQQRIFEPFYRAHDGSRRSAGSGLGLAIVRGFVDANGGSVEVESYPGQGATFVVSLPLVEGGR
jgi:two-component system sensor histidine kinase KdpD